MGCDTCTITVFFEDPFWVGVYERLEEGRYSVCKLTFGAEPRDYQVYEALLIQWQELKFSPAISLNQRNRSRPNPKRTRKEASKSLSGSPVGTKAQEALKLQQTEGKEARRKKSREVRQEEAELRYLLRQEKKRQRHRGR